MIIKIKVAHLQWSHIPFLPLIIKHRCNFILLLNLQSPLFLLFLDNHLCFSIQKQSPPWDIRPKTVDISRFYLILDKKLSMVLLDFILLKLWFLNPDLPLPLRSRWNMVLDYMIRDLFNCLKSIPRFFIFYGTTTGVSFRPIDFYFGVHILRVYYIGTAVGQLES